MHRSTKESAKYSRGLIYVARIIPSSELEFGEGLTRFVMEINASLEIVVLE